MDRFNVVVAWIGILAFLLTIPMAIAANLLTPRVLGWWARTSRVRSGKRLNRLKRELELLTRADKQPTELLSRLYLDRVLIACLVFFVSFVAYMTDLVQQAQRGDEAFTSSALLSLLTVLVSGSIAIAASLRVTDRLLLFSSERRATYRKQLESDIEDIGSDVDKPKSDI